MRRSLFGVLLLSLAAIAVSSLAFNSLAETNAVKGDYVEVRTASVFAGACHFNGEVTTTGRDALMAWNVKSGEWQGVNLTGVQVLAVINSDANLADTGSERHSEIIIGQNASDAQSRAILQALKSKYSSTLGRIASVRRAPLTFRHEGRTYTVNATDLATINVEAMPNDLCCKMPNLVWYSPLVPLDSRKVGYTIRARYDGDALPDRWERSGENSAFYGSFVL